MSKSSAVLVFINLTDAPLTLCRFPSANGGAAKPFTLGGQCTHGQIKYRPCYDGVNLDQAKFIHSNKAASQGLDWMQKQGMIKAMDANEFQRLYPNGYAPGGVHNPGGFSALISRVTATKGQAKAEG